MKQIIKELAECQKKMYALEQQLKDKDYWINKAKEEAGFIPEGEKDWLHVEVTTFMIEVSVHHDNYGGAKYWINGQWFDTPFPSKYPHEIDFETL
jgi:hypothetical protein